MQAFARIVQTRAELESSDYPSAVAALVGNVEVVESGYQGGYTYVPESTATPDGVNVLLPGDAPGAGRWLANGPLSIDASTGAVSVRQANGLMLVLYVSLASAPSVAAADAAGVALGKTVCLDANVTLAGDVVLAAKWNLAAGGVLTRGAHAATFELVPVLNPWMQCFNPADTGTLTLPPRTTVSQYNFGAIGGYSGSGATPDDTVPLQAALNMLQVGCNFQDPGGVHYISAPLYALSLDGSSRARPAMIWQGSSKIISGAVNEPIWFFMGGYTTFIFPDSTWLNPPDSSTWPVPITSTGYVAYVAMGDLSSDVGIVGVYDSTIRMVSQGSYCHLHVPGGINNTPTADLSLHATTATMTRQTSVTPIYKSGLWYFIGMYLRIGLADGTIFKTKITNVTYTGSPYVIALTWADQIPVATTSASFTGVIVNGILTASAVTGTIVQNQQIFGSSVPTRWIGAQLTGTPGGAGTYSVVKQFGVSSAVDAVLNVGSEAMTTATAMVVDSGQWFQNTTTKSSSTNHIGCAQVRLGGSTDSLWMDVLYSGGVRDTSEVPQQSCTQYIYDSFIDGDVYLIANFERMKIFSDAVYHQFSKQVTFEKVHFESIAYGAGNLGLFGGDVAELIVTGNDVYLSAFAADVGSAQVSIAHPIPQAFATINTTKWRFTWGSAAAYSDVPQQWFLQSANTAVTQQVIFEDFQQTPDSGWPRYSPLTTDSVHDFMPVLGCRIPPGSVAFANRVLIDTAYVSGNLTQRLSVAGPNLFRCTGLTALRPQIDVHTAKISVFADAAATTEITGGTAGGYALTNLTGPGTAQDIALAAAEAGIIRDPATVPNLYLKVNTAVGDPTAISMTGGTVANSGPTGGQGGAFGSTTTGVNIATFVPSSPHGLTVGQYYRCVLSGFTDTYNNSATYGSGHDFMLYVVDANTLQGWIYNPAVVLAGVESSGTAQIRVRACVDIVMFGDTFPID